MTDQIFLPLRVLDANGDPVAGAKLYFYESGTTTALTVYTAEDLATAHASPLVADAGGFAARAFYSGTPVARVRILDASDNLLFDLDPVPVTTSASGAATVSFSPVPGNTATTVQQAVTNNTNDILASQESDKNDRTATLTTGSADAYTLTAADTITAYSAGQAFTIVAHADNTGASTLNVDSVGPVNLYRFDATGVAVALSAGDVSVGGVYRVLYDGTQFVITTPLAATETTQGLVEKATTAEAEAATSGKYVDAALAKALIEKIGHGYNPDLTWQDMSASRVSNTAYSNDTGVPIEVFVSGDSTSAESFSISQDSGTTWLTILSTGAQGSDSLRAQVTIAPGEQYKAVTGTVSTGTWWEKRP